MSVYVDNARAALGRMKMSHMIADSPDELMAMARRIGVDPKWIQDAGTYREHFDIALSKRALAMSYGAREITRHELAEILHSRRVAPPTPDRRPNDMHRLPDGSGFCVVEMPLPRDHWSTAPGHNTPPMPFRLGTDHPAHTERVAQIRAAAQYAYRASTMNGTESIDPDALVQNIIVGLLGYWSPNGLGSMEWQNPNPVPSLFEDRAW